MQEQKTVEILKALGDEVRLSIVRKLASDGAMTAGCDITACDSVHKLSQPAMSHHFTKLVDAGVIRETKHGTQKLYELDEQLLAAVGIDSKKL